MQEKSESRGASLDAWIKSTWPAAVVYARSLLRDRPAAEDVVQDCYVNLLRKADVYDLLQDGVPLLMKSITNACLKKNVRARPMLSLNTAVRGDDGTWHGSDGNDPIDISGPEPSQAVLDAELECFVERALAELPELQRAAIELKGLGHSLQEIATILEVSPSNAGVLIYRGRQALARRLAPYLEKKPDEQTGQRSSQ